MGCCWRTVALLMASIFPCLRWWARCSSSVGPEILPLTSFETSHCTCTRSSPPKVQPQSIPGVHFWPLSARFSARPDFGACLGWQQLASRADHFREMHYFENEGAQVCSITRTHMCTTSAPPHWSQHERHSKQPCLTQILNYDPLAPQVRQSLRAAYERLPDRAAAGAGSGARTGAAKVVVLQAAAAETTKFAAWVWGLDRTVWGRGDCWSRVKCTACSSGLPAGCRGGAYKVGCVNLWLGAWGRALSMCTKLASMAVPRQASCAGLEQMAHEWRGSLHQRQLAVCLDMELAAMAMPEQACCAEGHGPRVKGQSVPKTAKLSVWVWISDTGAPSWLPWLYHGKHAVI